MSDEQKHLLNVQLYHQLERLKRDEPEIAREAAVITNTLFTNKPDLNAPKAAVEAYAALCVYHKQHQVTATDVRRLKTWLNHAGAGDGLTKPNNH